MNSELSCSLRWRWLFAGMAAVVVSAGLLYAIQSWQLPRITARVLQECRQLAAAGDTDAARKRYADYIQLQPGNTQAYEEYARLMLESDTEGTSPRTDMMALQLLDMAVQHGARSHSTKQLLVSTAMRLQNYSLARQMLNSMDLHSLQDADLYTFHGICALQQGEISEAEQSFRSALQICPQTKDAWTGLLEIRADVQEDIPGAWEIADQMLAVMPVEGRSARAWLYLRLNQIDQAGKAFLQTAQQAPDSTEHVANLAQFIMRTNMEATPENTPAIEFALTRLTALQTDRSDFLMEFNRADLAQRLKQYDAALAGYRRCMELRPGDPAAAGRLTEVLSSIGDYQQAEELLTSLPQTNALRLLRATLKARLLTEQSHWQEAIEVLNEAVHIAGDRNLKQQAQALLMECHRHLNQYDSAVSVGHKMVVASGSPDEARCMLIEALINADNYRDAIEQMQLIRKPEQHYAALIQQMIRSVNSPDKERQLNRAIDETERFSVSASLPAIIRAYLQANSGKLSDAISSMTLLAAENPDLPEYWETVVRLRTGDRQPRNAVGRSGSVSFTDSPSEDSEAASDDHATIRQDLNTNYHRLMHQGRSSEIVNAVKTRLQSRPARKEDAEAVATVLCNLAMSHREACAEIVETVLPLMNSHVVETSGASMEAFCCVLRDCGLQHQLSKLSPSLFADPSTIQTVGTIRDLVSEGVLNAEALQASNESTGGAGWPRYLIDILLAESEAVTDSPKAAVQRLLQVVKESPENAAAVAALLQIAGYDSAVRPDIPDYGFRLVQQHPDSADALFLLSCGLRSGDRLLESVTYARRAFAQKQNPVYLLHAAWSLLKAGNKTAAVNTLQLAQQAGLSEAVMHPLDRQLLQTMNELRDESAVQLTGTQPAELRQQPAEPAL